MTWEVWVPLLIVGIVKIVLTCLPNNTVGWIIKKFETHSKLDERNTVVTINGKQVESEEKIRFINFFNEATFLEKYYIFPGYEHLHLEPENSGIPIVLDTKMGKNNVRLFLFIHHDHINVVKQHNGKLVAYKLLSDNIQKMFYPNT